MKIHVHDDNDKLIGSYENGVWHGDMQVIPKIIHCLCTAFRDYPHHAFQKAIEKLPASEELSGA